MLRHSALGLAGVGLVELTASLRGTSVIDTVGSVVVDLAPLPVVEQTVRFVGIADKHLTRFGIATTAAATAGFALERAGAAAPPRWAAGLGLLAGTAALVRARRRLAERTARLERVPAHVEPLLEAPTSDDGAEEWPGLEPFVTDPGRFYVTDVNMRPPAIDLDAWRLQVGEAEFSYADLLRLGLQHRHALLACVHNRLGWDRIGQSTWTGVPVGEVLSAAHVIDRDSAPGHGLDLVMTAVDGYRQVLPLETALGADSWVVVGMGGSALPASHGFPARVMTPGVVGQYNGVKWLARLDVVPSGSVEATWVARGWPRETVWLRPMARIDSPARTGMPPRLPRRLPSLPAGPTTVVGTAWHPPHGVAAVEVRVDDGPWQRAELAREVSPSSWRRWRLEVPLDEGRHTLTARCISRDGTVQEARPSPPFPDGTTGHHQVRLRVR
ncbi:molybdopterin-dependent oxidoreductase [Nocardioides sp.]|uniref:molybdopterin-dependent oxidoreductase n=1 Tax=Nocardioides sp. TaxID=35761 RepID=UPI002B26A711|nr:molybdopterin-dependent oxidoreductase [Nocardioides sp.]